MTDGCPSDVSSINIQGLTVTEPMISFPCHQATRDERTVYHLVAHIFIHIVAASSYIRHIPGAECSFYDSTFFSVSAHLKFLAYNVGCSSTLFVVFNLKRVSGGFLDLLHVQKRSFSVRYQ